MAQPRKKKQKKWRRWRRRTSKRPLSFPAAIAPAARMAVEWDRFGHTTARAGVHTLVSCRLQTRNGSLTMSEDE